MIGRLRRVLWTALSLGRQSTAELPAPARPGAGHPEASRRIDDARRRLKATIPPPED